MKIMTTIRNTMCCVLLALLAVSCQPWYEREPLEVYYDNVTQVRLDINWLNHFEGKPEGMTVMMTKDGDVFSNSLTRIKNDVDSVYYFLGPGTYRVVVFNDDMNYFQTMKFLNSESYSSCLTRSVVDRVRSNRVREWDRNTTYMKQPEVIGVAVDSFTITEEDIEANRHFIDYRLRGIPDTFCIVRPLTVYDMTCRLNVFVRVNDLSRIRSVEGNISGMADGFVLTRIVRNAETGPLAMDSELWTGHSNKTLREVMNLPQYTEQRTRAESDTILNLPFDSLYHDDGQPHDWVCVSIPTFGLPHGMENPENRPAGAQKLKLSFTLSDGTVYSPFTYDVSRYIRYRRNPALDIYTAGRWDDEVTLTENIQLDLDVVITAPMEYPVLPYTVAPGTQGPEFGGFDVYVDPWERGDEIDVLLP